MGAPITIVSAANARERNGVEYGRCAGGAAADDKRLAHGGLLKNAHEQ
jgi:hypothetical protein